MGQKAHDYYVAFACSNCHSAVDGHLKTIYTAEELYDYWQRGFERTLDWAFEKGLITI